MRQTLRLNQEIAPEHFFFFPYIPLRGTPLYNIAKKEGLLLDNKKELHYLSAANDRHFTLNMKECPQLLTAVEYDEICRQMLAFQEANNRLSYTDGVAPEVEPARVEDKSFSLVDADNSSASNSGQDRPIESAIAIVHKQEKSLFADVRNLFRS